MRIKLILLIAQVVFVLYPVSLLSQPIKGVCRDSKDNSILPFVLIEILNGKERVYSDEKGLFSFPDRIRTDPVVLRLSLIGYRTELITVTVNDSFLLTYLTPTEYLLQAVTIYTESRLKDELSSAGVMNLKSEAVKNLSGSFSDVFRTLQTLPGISVNNEMSAKFNVRGGNHDENLVLVNGTQVYEPFHIKEATNASVGIFNVEMMRSVDLITGGFSAEYGDKMSSVLKIDYREGNDERLKGLAGMSLTNYDLLLEGPITDNSRFIIGARKSYVEYLMNLLDMDDRIHPDLYDLQGSLSVRLSDRNKLLLQFIHAGDTYYLDPEINSITYDYNRSVKGKNELFSAAETDFDVSKGDYYTTMLNLQWKSFLSNSSLLRTDIMYYYQYDNEFSLDTLYSASSGLNSKDYFYNYKRERRSENNLIIKTLEAKTTLNHKLSPYIEVKAGAGYALIKYEQNIMDFDKRRYYNNTDRYPLIVDTVIHASSGDDINDFTEVNSSKFSGFSEFLFQRDNFIFTLGGRVDYFGINRDFTFSPRVNLSYRTGNSAFRLAFGFFYQSPMYNQFKFSAERDDNTKSQKAVHYILGFDHSILNDDNIKMDLKAELFYKKYESLISSRRTTWWRIIYSKENDASGYAKGIDATINFSFNSFYGWLSYSLLKTMEDIINDGKPEYPRYTDQRHTFSFVLDTKLGRGWDANIRIFFGSGSAFTPSESKYNTTARRWQWIEGKRNSATLPVYSRIDFKTGKRFLLFGLNAEAFLDIINLFNQTNLMAYRYTFNPNGTPKREDIKLFPIIPSLGLKLSF